MGPRVGSPRVTLAGESFVLLDRAAYWEADNALLVSDLHLGKAETFQRSGLPVPSGHAASDLERLSRLAETTNAAKLYILGDLVHAKSGLTDALVAEVQAWRTGFPADIHLISGNHERHAGQLPESWDLEATPDLEWRGLLLVHQPQETAAPHVCGHVHPVVNLRSALEALRLPCFVLEPTRLTLPAFGSFVGGHALKLAQDRQLFAVADGEVIALTR